MAFHFSPVAIPSSVSSNNWFNWKWQLRHSLKTKQDYESYFQLTPKEQEGFHQVPFATQSTPYYAQIATGSPDHPLRQIIIPQALEKSTGQQSMPDPLGEEQHSPVPHIIHRYPDRVLFLITDICPIYCRYCTRKRFTATDKKIISTPAYQKAMNYIKKNKGVREVILSGGDPLILPDSLLENTLKDIRHIDHIEIIRIGSRMPAVCPMRFSTDLVKMLKKYQPVFVMSHFNHPAEITAESATALHQLADNGIPVFNQMVLINSLNNHPAVVQALCRRLLFLRARPYYMFQCDPSLGTDHLRTSIQNSQWIQKTLWGVLSGLATPRLAIDIPGGGGKIEITPASKIPTDNQSTLFKGWDGKTGSYINPHQDKLQYPTDTSLYLSEWNRISQQSYGSQKP